MRHLLFKQLIHRLFSPCEGYPSQSHAPHGLRSVSVNPCAGTVPCIEQAYMYIHALHLAYPGRQQQPASDHSPAPTAANTFNQALLTAPPPSLYDGQTPLSSPIAAPHPLQLLSGVLPVCSKTHCAQVCPWEWAAATRCHVCPCQRAPRARAS